MGTVVTTYSPSSTVAGRITKTGISYSVATGLANCDIAYNSATGARTYAFFQYDTSDIPDTAIVTGVEWICVEDIAQPSTHPQYTSLYLGTWLGTSLDASSADYNGGNLIQTVSPHFSAGTYDLVAGGDFDPIPYINKTGKTDLKITDDSALIICGRNYNYKSNCQLRITYDTVLPPSLPLLGVGY